MSTRVAQHKLTNFAHAHDPFIRRITQGADPQRDMEWRVSHCLDVHGRKYGPAWAAYDGKLPAVRGWPRNPMAPKVFNVSTLELELKILKTEVTRLSKFGDAPTDTSTAAAPGSTRAFALGAAMSKLASTQAAIERQRSSTP